MNTSTLTCRSELEAVFAEVGEILQDAAQRVAARISQRTAGNRDEIEDVRPEIHFLPERYGNHYSVVWIRCSDAWHPSEDDLPEEFTIDATLLQRVSVCVADEIAERANLERDLLGHRGRWAIVIPADLI